MRQIKLIVMTVGVALSVSPFFTSAFAQQSNNQANLLLEVQSMRQEIAQLRDMVERQQFEMRKLKREQQEMQAALTARQSAAPQNYGSAVNGAPSNGAVIDNGGNVNTQGLNRPVSNYSDSTANTTSANTVINNNAANTTYTSNQAGSNIEERVITASPQNAGNSVANDGSVQVVDRSFTQQVRDVPITGKGATNQVINTQGLNTEALNPQTINSAQNQVVNQANTAANQVVDNVEQVINTQSGGVIAIPQNSDSQWVTKQASEAGVIAANSVPVNPNVVSGGNINNQVNTQVAAAKNVLATTDGSASSAPTLSEDDYYGQGFELLKQSKYEEASTIFERQIEAYPRGNLADDAHYWIAEAMHVSRKLDVSKQHLKTIIEDYPQSPRLPDAMLKKAYIEQSQGNNIEAKILFQEIVNFHPKSDAAIAAKNQLASNN